MRTDLFNKYIWIVDAITSHGRLTRAELNDLWLRSARSDGKPILHRSFFNYRRDIESIFNIDILCDNYDRYYIEKPHSSSDENFRNWMLDSFALRSAITGAVSLSDRIIVEKIPSARQFLPLMISAIQESKKVSITYAGFTRSLPEEGIVFAPYFLKLFKQRWYVIGLREASNEIRTYALDRIRELNILPYQFQMPDYIEPSEYFADLYGITSSKGEVKDVIVSASVTTAKYLRALPLHHSQREEQYSDRSLFHFRLKLTDDFLRELMSFGPDIQVVAPQELRVMMIDRLQQTLRNYEPSPAAEAKHLKVSASNPNILE